MICIPILRIGVFEVGQKKSGGERNLQQCTITGEGSLLKKNYDLEAIRSLNNLIDSSIKTYI